MSDLPLINILIRTSNRAAGFKRLLASIVNQDYEPIRIIISYDNDAALRYIPKGLEVIKVEKHPEFQYGYDLYCNTLKSMVEDGYFVIIDDDNILKPNILKELPLSGPGLIVQVQIGNHIAPVDLNFKPGMAGMPCMILHHSLKDLADISPHGKGDSYWIKSVLSKVALPFIPMVVVFGETKGLGRCNG